MALRLSAIRVPHCPAADRGPKGMQVRDESLCCMCMQICDESLDDPSATAIARALAATPRLVTLSLSFGSIGPRGAAALSDAFQAGAPRMHTCMHGWMHTL